MREPEISWKEQECLQSEGTVSWPNRVSQSVRMGMSMQVQNWPHTIDIHNKNHHGSPGESPSLGTGQCWR